MKTILAVLVSIITLSSVNLAKTKYVYDEESYLSSEDSLIIEEVLQEFNDSSIQLGVYITEFVPREGYIDIDEATRKIGRKIGWGYKEGKIGAIMLIAIGERRMYLAFDDGLPYENYHAQMAVDVMTPHFKDKNYKEGILAGIEKLKEILGK